MVFEVRRGEVVEAMPTSVVECSRFSPWVSKGFDTPRIVVT